MIGVLAVIGYLAIQFGVYKSQVNGLLLGSLYVPAALAGALVILLLFLYAKWRKFDLVKIFLPVAMVGGLLFMAATPTLRGADEELHFYRAYEVSTGHLLSTKNENGVGGRELPSSLQQIRPTSTLDFPFSKMREKVGIPLNPKQTKFIEFPTTSLYAPVQYLPQAMGIAVARLFHANPVALVYCGRFFNLLAWALLGFWAIKMSRGSPLLFLFSLFPMSLHMASTLSPDAITNGVALLFIALIIRLCYFERAQKATRPQLYLLAGLAFVIALCKIVYLPLCLLLFMLPQEKFVTKGRRLAFVLGTFVAAFLINGLWMVYSFGFLNEVRPGVDGAAQVAYILHHPVAYFFVLVRTISYFFNMYLHSAVGAALCLWDVPIYYWVSNVFLFLMAYLALEHNVITPTVKARWIAAIAALGVIVITHTALYVQWTKVGEMMVDGMQGRYFLPLVPLLLFAAAPLKSRRWDKVNVLVACTGILAIYPVAISLLLKHLA